MPILKSFIFNSSARYALISKLAGIKDIVTKVRRSTNPTNVVKATLEGLQKLRDPEIETARRKALSKNELVVEQEESLQTED